MQGMIFILRFYNIALDINLERHQLICIIILYEAFLTNSEKGCPLAYLWTLKHPHYLVHILKEDLS